jgi:hypothetical protein
MVGEIMIYNPDTNAYDDPVPVCSVDTTKLGIDRFVICDEPNDMPLTLLFGRPGLSQDVILFNFNIQ